MKKWGVGLLVVLLALVVGVRLRAPDPAAEPGAPGTVTLRVGHWLLHAGMREAMNEAIAEYQRNNPHVRIEQNPVPLKTWVSWQRAQWTGGTAPDLMQLGNGTNDETQARYFRPLTPWVDQPNPYNAGTPLEGVPWRATFVDGLVTWPSFLPGLGEFYGVPCQVNAMRLFYNADLLREIAGDAPPPATLEALMALDAQVRAYARQQRRQFVTLSLSGPYSDQLLARVLPAFTQRVTLAIDAQRIARSSPPTAARAYLAGQWDLATAGPGAALEVTATLGAMAQPGFRQMARDDSLFYFLQQKALMVFTGSWDYAALVKEAPFTVGVMDVPLPRPGEGQFGAHTLGRPAELEASFEAIFGLSRWSEHPEVAVDFLHFLTSWHTARRMTERSRRLTAVAGVPIPEELRPFAPMTEGPVRGFNPVLPELGGALVALTFDRGMHLLVPGGRPGDVEQFREAVRPELHRAMARGLELTQKSALAQVRQADSRFVLALLEPVPDLAAAAQVQETMLDHRLGWLEAALAPAPVPGPERPVFAR